MTCESHILTSACGRCGFPIRRAFAGQVYEGNCPYCQNHYRVECVGTMTRQQMAEAERIRATDGEQAAARYVRQLFAQGESTDAPHTP